MGIEAKSYKNNLLAHCKIIRTRTKFLNHGTCGGVILFLLFFLQSVSLFAQLDPLPPIVPNPNRGLPVLYSIADNRSELYYVAPDPATVPAPTFVNITFGGAPITFSGEGGGYRSTDQLIYVFRDNGGNSDMYSIDPVTGIALLVQPAICTGHVEGAEFYINNSTGDEVLVIIHNGDGGDEVLAVNPNANGPNPAWSPYAGYPKPLSGARTRADGISWDPVGAEFYVQNDDNVDYYTLDINTGVTTYAFTSALAVDGEGITYASDGKNYIEDEGQAGQGRMLFSVDVPSGAMVPVAQLGSTGDVESIMGNLGVRDDSGDAPSTYGYASHSLPVIASTPVTIFLGSSQPDSEDPFINFSTGTSDDNNGDDEDGVTSGGQDFSGQLLSLGSVKSIDIIAAGAGVLSAWIDFNRDGDFSDPGEQIATDVAPSGGLINLNVPIPVTAVPGVSYARFRYSSETGLAAGNTTARDGEVEDYQVIIQDTISCPPGETNEEYFTYSPIYATAVIVDDSVSNEDDALGNNDNTTARLNSSGDELVLEMGEIINSGDAVTVNGEDGDDLDIWVSSSATGPWTQVGFNAQLDFTFNSPISWLYIRFKRGDGDGTEDLSFIEATKSYSNFRCTPDNDGDAIPDRSDLDDDNDGIPDEDELATLVSTGQPSCGGETVLDFSAAPVLEAGTDRQIGAVYRVANVTTGTDALITVKDIFNASINTIDDNGSDPTYFKPMTAFNFAKTGDFGYIEYHIQFVNSGGSTPVIVPKFFMNFNDIDGSAEYGEQTWADNPSTYTIDNPTDLTMTQDGSWVIGTSGTASYPGAGNTNPQVNFNVNYNSKSEISVRFGAVAFQDGASSGGRQHSIQFNCVTNYVSPETYGLDSDSDGIANHLDLDSDNDGIYDVVEAGHDLPHTNGVISGPYGLNGLADAVETNAESGIINYTIRNSDGTDATDYLDNDSDDDGCTDANEAYGNAAADGDGNGYYGTGNPPVVNTDGTVAAASYGIPADGDADSNPDYRQAEAPPAITSQPPDRVICADGNTTFPVVVTNADTFQWQQYNGATWTDITDSGIHSGTNTNTLVITAAQPSDDGNQYRLISLNSSFICSTVTSAPATLTVVQPAAPASGGDQVECADNPVQTLTATATPPPGSSLVWYDAPSGGNVVGSPTLSTVGTITYYAESQDSGSGCPSATRTAVSLTIQPRPTITVTGSPSCNIFLTAYSLEVTVSGGTVSSSAGTVTNAGGNVWDITDVPDGTDIILTVTDVNGCVETLPVTAPDCSCPVVSAPTSGGNQAYCSGDPVPPVTATVGAGHTVDWYDAASGGNLLLSGNMSYTPSGSGVYYAEARNTITGCVSGTRTGISVTENFPATSDIGANQTVFVNGDAVFTAATTNSNTYQWQVSTDGGGSYTDIVDGLEYTGTNTLTLTATNVQLPKNGYLYRLQAFQSGSACPPVTSAGALLTVRLRTVITNRRITVRTNPD